MEHGGACDQLAPRYRCTIERLAFGSAGWGGALNVVRRSTVLPFFAVIFMGMAAMGQNKPPQPLSAPEKNEAPKAMPGATPDGANLALPIDPKTYVIRPQGVLYIKVCREKHFT